MFIRSNLLFNRLERFGHADAAQAEVHHEVDNRREQHRQQQRIHHAHRRDAHVEGDHVDLDLRYDIGVQPLAKRQAQQHPEKDQRIILASW